MEDDIVKEIELSEGSLLKVPFERLSRVYRSRQQSLEEDFGRIATRVAKMKDSNSLAVKTELIQLARTLKDIKAKLVTVFDEEEFVLRQCSTRITHLEAGLRSNGSQTWKKERLDRLVVDFLLREGFYDTATAYVQSQPSRELFNVDLFHNAKAIEESLLRGDVTSCLLWCQEHKPRLTKLKSSLEFKLRLQQFIEMIRVDDKFSAIKHASTYFVEFPEHVADIKVAMMLLLYAKQQKLSKYQALLSSGRWSELVLLFRRNNVVISGIGSASLLLTALQTGFSVLKTNACCKENPNPNCPVCQPEGFDLSELLPFSLHSNSRLVCGISGIVMNDDNPPMMLPNGYVYSQQALEEMQSRLGLIRCPRTGQEFDITTVKKVFVA